MNKRFRSYLHVVIQFSTIVYLIYSEPSFAQSFWLGIEIIGFILGLWSVWVMRKSVFSVFPDPEPAFILIENGPYKFIRHPMYLALFLVLIPLVISFPIINRIILMVIFTINQILKINYEEKILLKKISGYKQYTQRTKRLIPFLY